MRLLHTVQCCRLSGYNLSSALARVWFFQLKIVLVCKSGDSWEGTKIPEEGRGRPVDPLLLLFCCCPCCFCPCCFCPCCCCPCLGPFSYCPCCNCPICCPRYCPYCCPCCCCPCYCSYCSCPTCCTCCSCTSCKCSCCCCVCWIWFQVENILIMKIRLALRSPMSLIRRNYSNDIDAPFLSNLLSLPLSVGDWKGLVWRKVVGRRTQ